MVAGQVAGTVPATPLHFERHNVVRSGLMQPIREDTWGDFPSFGCSILCKSRMRILSASQMKSDLRSWACMANCQSSSCRRNPTQVHPPAPRRAPQLLGKQQTQTPEMQPHKTGAMDTCRHMASVGLDPISLPPSGVRAAGAGLEQPRLSLHPQIRNGEEAVIW